MFPIKPEPVKTSSSVKGNTEKSEEHARFFFVHKNQYVSFPSIKTFFTSSTRSLTGKEKVGRGCFCDRALKENLDSGWRAVT